MVKLVLVLVYPCSGKQKLPIISNTVYLTHPGPNLWQNSFWRICSYCLFPWYGATFLVSNTKQEYSNCKIGVKYQIKYED